MQINKSSLVSFQYHSLEKQYCWVNIQLMQKLLRSSKLSCSKPLITLLKQQISNCFTVKKSHGQCALLSDCYPHKSSVVVCTLCISNA